MADGKVEYQVNVNDSDVPEQVEKVNKTIKDKAQSGSSAMKEIWTGALRALGEAFVELGKKAASSVADVVKTGVEYNATMEGYRTVFTTMLGGADAADKLTDSLKTMAAKTPLAMSDLADASKTLLAFGSTSDQIPDQLKRLGDVALGDAQKLGTFATAFGRIQSNGKASMEEINMMIDQGFNPLNNIAKNTGETMEQVRARVSAGKVSFEELNKALQDATNKGGQFYNAMESQSKTFKGQMSTLEDNVHALAGALTSDLFDNLAGTMLPRVNSAVDTLLEGAQENGIRGALGALGNVIGALTEGLPEEAQELFDSGMELVHNIADGMVQGIPDFLSNALPMVLDFSQSLRNNAGKLVDEGMHFIVSMAEGIANALPDLIAYLPEIVSNIAGVINDNGPKIIQTGIQVIWALIKGLINAIPALIANLPKIIMAIVNTIQAFNWISLGRTVVNSFGSGIRGMVSSVANWGRDLIDGFVGGIRSRINSVIDAAKSVASAVSRFLHFSRPDEGPLHEYESWMPDMVHGLAEGITDNSYLVKKAAEQLADQIRVPVDLHTDYNMPNVSGLASDLSLKMSATSAQQTQINVPVIMDGREVARATAWWTGEQLSWEEM